MPKAFACGRLHALNEAIRLPISTDQLDNGTSLPGRPPHTICSIKASGNPTVTIPATQDCEAYDLLLDLRIPLEVVVKDCCGFTYCLKSYINTSTVVGGGSLPDDMLRLRIPLCTKLVNVGDTQLYIKTRVRLCTHVDVGDTCTNDTYNQNLQVHVDILVEACLMRMQSWGVSHPDPYCAQGPQVFHAPGA